MATIAGVTVTFALPENDTRNQNVIVGEAEDGSNKYFKHRASDKIIVIPIRGLTTTTKESLLDALEADADRVITIVPDSHVDLGNGVGTSITAFWLDTDLDFRKTRHDFWEGSLTFKYVS